MMPKSAVRPFRVLGLLALMSCASVTTDAAVSCTASASGVAFGIYDPLQAAPDTSTGSVTVSCSTTPGSPAFVFMSMSLSTGLSGVYSPRQMFSGANTLDYNLYSSAAYSQVWGNGNNGTYTGSAWIFVTPGNPRTVSRTVYGRVPAGQNAAAGTYADSIVVTVTY